MVNGDAASVLDAQAAAILECTEALVHYVEELHAPHGLDQFLSAAERGDVARFIDGFGDNPARKGEFLEIRSGPPGTR